MSLSRKIGPNDYQVLIEDLSDHFFLLKDIRYSAEYKYDENAERQLNALSPEQEGIQLHSKDPSFYRDYPLRKFGRQIQHPSTRTLDENPWPWVTAQETSHREFSYFSIAEEYSMEVSLRLN